MSISIKYFMVFYHAGYSFLRKNYGIIVNNKHFKTQICGIKIFMTTFQMPISIKYSMVFYHAEYSFLRKNYGIIVNNKH